MRIDTDRTRSLLQSRQDNTVFKVDYLGCAQLWEIDRLGEHDVAATRLALFYEALRVDTEARGIEPPHHDPIVVHLGDGRGLFARPLLHRAHRGRAHHRHGEPGDATAGEQLGLGGEALLPRVRQHADQHHWHVIVSLAAVTLHRFLKATHGVLEKETRDEGSALRAVL